MSLDRFANYNQWKTEFETVNGPITTTSAWPIGGVFISTLATNPATLIGFGTWVAFGAGRVLIGLDANDTAFDIAEETGGAKTATPSAHSGTAIANHVVTQANAHANHVVTQPSAHSNHVVTQPNAHTDVLNHVHVEQLQGGTTGTTTGTHLMGSAATGGSLRSAGQSTLNPTANGVASQAHGGTAVDAHSAHAGAGVDAHSAHAGAAVDAHAVTQPSAHAAISTVPPYIVVYFWKRTA